MTLPEPRAPLPMIEGRLVRLRAREPEDLERGHQWTNDREVARFLLLRYPQSRVQEEAWLRGNSSTSFYSLGLAIDTLENIHIGNIDLTDVSPENRTGVIGVMIGDTRYWGRGYGSDAVRTLTRFAFATMNLQRVYLQTFAYNERAQAAFKKAGFQEEGRLRRHLYAEGRYWDVVLMGCLRDEFEASDSNPTP